jgi:multiple sugar transport system substrate-binding protein
VTFCTGKDTSGYLKRSLADFNAKFASAGLRANILEFPEDVDEQRDPFIQRQQARSADCDVSTCRTC